MAEEDIQEVDPSGMLATLDRATIDMQIATARRYPREISKFQRNLFELATSDREIARSMFYRIPRGGKQIEGPTIRLAEIAASSWGNMRYGGRIIDEAQGYVTSQGMAFDLEKNVAVAIENRRRIVDSDGKRYNIDMIQITGNAAISIALRNAILRVIPSALLRPVLLKAKEVALGEGLTMEQRRKQIIESYEDLDISQADILKTMNRHGIQDLNTDDLLSLLGYRNSIQDGETTWSAISTELIRARELADPASRAPSMPQPTDIGTSDPEAGAADPAKSEPAKSEPRSEDVPKTDPPKQESPERDDAELKQIRAMLWTEMRERFGSDVAWDPYRREFLNKAGASSIQALNYDQLLELRTFLLNIEVKR